MKTPTVFETTSSREYAQAEWWRQRKMQLTYEQLAELTGYSPLSIRLFEKGTTSRGATIKPEVWHRYKMACAGVNAMRKQGEFKW